MVPLTVDCRRGGVPELKGLWLDWLAAQQHIRRLVTATKTLSRWVRKRRSLDSVTQLIQTVALDIQIPFIAIHTKSSVRTTITLYPTPVQQKSEPIIRFDLAFFPNYTNSYPSFPAVTTLFKSSLFNIPFAFYWLKPWVTSWASNGILASYLLLFLLFVRATDYIWSIERGKNECTVS